MKNTARPWWKLKKKNSAAGFGGHTAKYQLVDKNTRISNNDTNASARTRSTWKRKHNGKKKKSRKKCFTLEINARNDKNVGMNNARARNGRYRGRNRRNMNQRRKQTYQVENYTTRTTCTSQCETKHTWQIIIIFLARKTWFLHENRNFGQNRKQPHDRKNTMAVWDGLMWGGKKKTCRERISKIDFGKRNLCYSQGILRKLSFDPSPLSAFLAQPHHNQSQSQTARNNTILKASERGFPYLIGTA